MIIHAAQASIQHGTPGGCHWAMARNVIKLSGRNHAYIRNGQTDPAAERRLHVADRTDSVFRCRRSSRSTLAMHRRV
jgi:hypothetical protein